MANTTQKPIPPTRPKKENIKVIYLRVLRSREPKQADLWAAGELIAAKYATGTLHRPIAGTPKLFSFAPTAAGRLFADQIEQELAQAAGETRRKAVKAAVVVFGAIGTILATIATDVGKAWLMKLLGL